MNFGNILRNLRTERSVFQKEQATVFHLSVGMVSLCACRAITASAKLYTFLIISSASGLHLPFNCVMISCVKSLSLIQRLGTSPCFTDM